MFQTSSTFLNSDHLNAQYYSNSRVETLFFGHWMKIMVVKSIFLAFHVSCRSISIVSIVLTVSTYTILILLIEKNDF